MGGSCIIYIIKIQKQIDKSTVQTPVHLGVFTHDYSVLLTVPPPPVHTWSEAARKEREKEKEKYFFIVHSTLRYYNSITTVIQYIINCTLWIRLPYNTNYAVQYWLIIPLHSLHLYLHTLHLYITVYHTFSNTTV